MFGKPEYQPAVVEHEGSVTDAGYYRGLFAAIEANLAANDATLPKTWPLGLTIKDWTTYTKAELIACKGPGDA